MKIKKFFFIVPLFMLAQLAHPETWRISINETVEQANNSSSTPQVSATGQFVVYSSHASNLVKNDSNQSDDIFVYDQATKKHTRVSVNSEGEQANGGSWSPSISANGRYIVFHSVASNLVPNDTNKAIDIFLHDRMKGKTTRVNLNQKGEQANDHSYYATISANGNHIAFQSTASNLVEQDTNKKSDIFVFKRTTGVLSRISVNSDGEQADNYSYSASISADGRYIAFGSTASNLLSMHGNKKHNKGHIFVHDQHTATTTQVSINRHGQPANSYSYYPSISGDGQSIAFRSEATNLVDNDDNGFSDSFVYDLQHRTITRVNVSSLGQQANSETRDPVMSANGRYVVFQSNADNLVADDDNHIADIFVHDRQTGTTRRVNISCSGKQANDVSYTPSLSEQGTYIVYTSDATNLGVGDSNKERDIFISTYTNSKECNLSSCRKSMNTSWIWQTDCL